MTRACCSYSLRVFLPGFLCLFIITPSFAQKSLWNDTKQVSKKAGDKLEKNKSSIKRFKEHILEWGLDTNYTHAVCIGGKLNTNGWSGLISYSKRTAPGKSNFFELSFSEVKHEKQIKQQRENNSFPELGSAAPFVFGKINNLYLLQLGIGREQLLLPGVLDGNISVSFRYSAGISLAMLKPYYLKLIHVDYIPDQVVSVREEKYSDDNSDLFLSRDNILGASKWSKGLSEIQYVPGIFIEGAFIIEPAKNKAFIQIVSLGGQFSAYTKSLLVMADRKAYPYMGTLFVGMRVGKRWK